MSIPLQSAPTHYLYNCLHTCPYHFSLLLLTTSTIASTHVHTTSVCSYSPPLQLPPHISVPLQSAPTHYLYNYLHTCPYHFSLLLLITSTIASTHVHTTSVCSYSLPLQLPPHMSIPLQSAPNHYLYNCLQTCPYHLKYCHMRQVILKWFMRRTNVTDQLMDQYDGPRPLSTAAMTEPDQLPKSHFEIRR